MVNREVAVRPLAAAASAVRVYIAVVISTLAVLAILASADSPEATEHAWGHAIVVAVLAIVLPLRLRAARAGGRGAIRAVGLIGSVLFVVNVVEALVPGFVPVWMQAQMFVVAALMLVIVLDVVRWSLTAGRWDRSESDS